MAYSLISDLREAVPDTILIQVTDDNGLGAIIEQRVTYAIAEADALIDTYLNGKYTTPLSPVPAALKRISMDLALYYLYKRRQFEVSDTLMQSYKEAIRLLESIRDGKTTLGVDDGVNESGGIFKTNKTSSSRVFTSDVLAGY